MRKTNQSAVAKMRETAYRLSDLLETLYIPHCGGLGLARRTIGTYDERLRHFFGWFERKYDRVPTTHDLSRTADTRDIIGAYLAWYRGQGASVSTRNLARNALLMFSRWLYEQTYTHEEGVGTIKRAKPPKVSIHPLDYDQITTLEGTIDQTTNHGYRDLAIWRFMLDTGARLAEVCNLQLNDVELTTRSGRPITNGIAFIFGKGSKERKVGFGHLTTRTLLTYRDTIRRPDPDEPADADFFFLTRSGLRLLEEGLYTMLRRLGQRAGVPLHPHLLRHTFATHYLRNGGTLTDLQMHMGHATPQQTLCYTHLIAAENNAQIQQARSLIDARQVLARPVLGELTRVRRTDLRRNQAQNGRRERAG